MSDLISRQAAIDFIDAGRICNPNEPRWSDNEVVNFLKSRPSAQPVLVGKWETVPDKDNGIDFRCSACHRFRFHNGEMRKKYKYCPNCGAKMERGE